MRSKIILYEVLGHGPHGIQHFECVSADFCVVSQSAPTQWHGKAWDIESARLKLTKAGSERGLLALVVSVDLIRCQRQH